MIKLEIVKYLIAEIELEQRMLSDYQEKWKIATKQADENKTEKYISAYTYFKWEGRNPSKSRITSNIKKIRQLMVDISKDVMKQCI